MTEPAAPPRIFVVAATLAMTALVALTLFGEFGGGLRGGLLGVDLTIGLLACAAVPLLFTRPLPTALLLAVGAAVAVPATAPATLATLQVARTQPFRRAVGVALAGVVAHAVRGLWRPQAGLDYAWWLVLDVAVHAALLAWGAQARTQALLMAGLRDRAVRAEAEQDRRVDEARVAERARIAREMHDVLAHRLSLVATHAGALEYRPDAPPERLAQAAGIVRVGVRQALDELREVVTLLRAPSEEALTPQPGVADLDRLVEETRAAGTPVTRRGELAAEVISATTGRTAFRIVQEGLTNARRHAPGHEVDLLLTGTPADGLRVELANPLVGATSDWTGTGSGLIGLAERIRLAGGEMTQEVAGDRWLLRVWLPWR